MFKLTLNPDANPTIANFSQTEIIIGNKNSGLAHFKISDPAISEVHIKIINQGNRFLIINSANDPFTSLNGIPFGKKSINHLDRIQIGQHVILFEVSETKSPTEQTTHTDGNDRAVEDAQLHKEMTEPVSKEELDFIDIEALLKEVDLWDSKKQMPESVPTLSNESSTLSSQKSAHPPLAKDEPAQVELGDSPPVQTSTRATFEDAKPVRPRKESLKADLNPPEESNIDPQETYVPGSWKKLTGFLVAFVAICVLVCSGIYFKASGKNSQEEKKIAAGTADIAMAMSHAQLNHIAPSKQNWADPDFIQNNLACVLSPNLHSQAQIDDDGQFTRYPYILRVYTSSDLGRFIVIAQPAPNLLQWLVHKKAMVVDSSAMEMRKITDLKKLNRLLANPNPLEGKNGVEISKVVKEGTLLSLASLSGNNNHWGFPPPKALAYIRPGAENFIYNAPRYYPFGESFLRKAVSLSDNDVTSSEVSSLQDEMNELSKFPDLVLYTSQGLQASIEAQKALTTFSPNRKFLVGYVKFNQKGYVASSHIFMNDEANEIALLEPGVLSTRSLLERTISDEGDSDQNSTFENDLHFLDKPFAENSDVDTNHPLFLRLQAIASSRSRALTPISEKIIILVHRQNIEIIPDFKDQIAKLNHEYLETDQIHRTRMVQELAKLYQEYSEMPLEEFMKFIEASKMTSFINETLKTQKEQIEEADITENKIQLQIDALSVSKNLGDLDEAVQKTSTMLNLEMFPDPARLIVMQEKMYNTVLDKLSNFLLYPDSIYARAQLKDHERTALLRILKTSWVSGDEYDFFVGEFDYLKNINSR
jgi:hypothetical protein